jgi:hypothetical protein
VLDCFEQHSSCLPFILTTQLFVMMKVFRVPAGHEILFHRPLNEYELTSLLSQQFAARQRRVCFFFTLIV